MLDLGKTLTHWNALGRHGIRKCNNNDLLLLQMCTELNLVIGNTLFQQKDKCKTIKMHPGSRQWHLIDYVLMQKRERQGMNTVRVMRGAECWTAHCLVRAKFKFVIKPKFNCSGPSLPHSLNIATLKDNVTRRRREANL